MSGSLGPIAVPDPPQITAFPLRVDYGTARELDHIEYVHRFDAPGLKTEQRFYRGAGARRFRIRKAQLACKDYETLRNHWDQARGVYAWFHYAHPNQDGSTETVPCRYADPVISFDHQAAMLAGDPGLTLIEARDMLAPPVYTSAQIDDGIPSAALLAALLKTEQELIPLIQIAPRAGGVTLYLSDRRVNVNSFDYLPRLLDWSGLSQSRNQNNDAASFKFGNADGVWTELFKTVNFKRGTLVFGFFHVATRILIALWRGAIRDWSRDPASRVIEIRAADGIFELNLPYPTRQITRTCWKEFKSAWCPYTGPLTTCDKSWEQCVERGMTLYFGGEISKPQQVRIEDNSTGTWGWGRSMLKSVSIAEDTIYQRVLQEIYTDIPMKINCDVAAGRDESEFYSALGIVGEGPITGYSSDLTQHLLDDAPPHDPQKNGGWRGVRGIDPSTASFDYFGLSQAPWGTVPPGSTYAAGTAFAEIRRTDAKGLQLSKVSDRKMVVMVTGGLGGWTWTAPGARQWTQPLTNTVWAAVNVYLRGIGLKADYSRPDLIPAAVMESYLLLDGIIAAAALCDAQVPKLVGAGNERQFPFRGVLREQKPVRDWIEEILTCCLGYYYFLNGRFGIGIRINSSVLAGNAFTRATVLENSFTAEARESQWNHLTVEFADEEYEWALNSVQVYDIDNAKLEGTPSSPRFKVGRLPLSGVSNKSQASRLAMTRLKEEMGGGTVEDQDRARTVRLRSTVIALGTLPGDVCSFDDPSLAGNRVEFRIARRTLNPDWSIDFEGEPCADSMYDVAIGPKPDDVPADPVPPERFPSPQGLAWMPNEVQPFDGDPLYDTDEWTFALWQDYTIARTGVWDAALWVRGEMVINKFQGYDAPMIYGVTFTTGGTLPGGRTYYIALAQRDASFAGRYTPMSNLVAIWVPVGLSVKLTLQTIVPVAAPWPGYAVWMGTDIRRMSKQINHTDQALPSTLTIDVFYKQTDPMPWPSARKVRVKTKRVHHSGVAGLQVQEVIGANQIRTSEWIGSTDNWVGQYLSVLADWSDGSVPLWNFRITAFDPATGTITVDPPCVRGAPEDSVEALDVMVVRARVTSATSDTVTCALWRNSIALNQFGADGLEPGAERGLMLRILDGAGQGQTRLVTDNTRDTHTVDVPWDVIPDATSVLIVEDPDWVNEAESSTPSVEEGLLDVEIRVRVANLADHVVLVGGFLVDDQEHETFEELAVLREIYIFGQPYEVRSTAGSSDETSLIDQTLRVDTSAGDVAVELTAAGPYFGRSLLVVNDGVGTGAGRVLVTPLAGDAFQTGDDAVILDKPGDWVEFVAGGDPAETTRARTPDPGLLGRRPPVRASQRPQLRRGLVEARPIHRPLPRSNERHRRTS